MWNQTGHAVLDLLGFVPLLGIVTDLINAVWYGVEGNYFEMACSIVSVFPALGDVGGKALKAVGKTAKYVDAGDLLKVGSQVVGNYGSLALSGTILVTNSFEIGMHLMDESYEGNVWDNVTAVGFALLATVCGAKGLDESSKAFKALKNKPAGIGSGKVGSFLKNTWNDNRGIASFGNPVRGKATKAFDIVEYGDKTLGFENHHGVLDVWATHNIDGYKSRASKSTAIALTKSQHDATKAVYREWLFEKTGKRVGGSVEWTSVLPREIQALSERMFDAANVPLSARNDYYREFNRYIYGLGN